LATQKSHPSTPGRTSMSGPTQTLLIESEDARVHCAVLNVRPDTDHLTPPTPPPAGNVVVRNADRPCQKQRLPAPSGPNSVPTRRTPAPSSGPRTPRGACSTGSPQTRAGRTGQRSTLEHHPTHSPATREWATDPGAGAALHHPRKGRR